MESDKSAGMLANAGPLFARAKAAYLRASESASNDRALGQMDALEAIVFSVVALEGFINELAVLAALPPIDGTEEDPIIVDLARVLEETERSRGSPRLKFMLTRGLCTGTTYHPGHIPYQDFVLLVDLRNALVHYRPLDRLTAGGEGGIEFTPARILGRLAAKNILADDTAEVSPWLLRVSTVAVARWSCQTASGMVLSVLDALPECSFKIHQAEFFYRNPFEAPK